MEAIKKCVMCGLGIALLPSITVQSELKEKKLHGMLTDKARIARK
ncbi:MULTISPECIES: hypothetical protein [Bacillus]|nr:MULTISPECIES: hypothetical protein [Bacillus]